MFTLIASHHIHCSLRQCGPSRLPQLLTGLPKSSCTDPGQITSPLCSEEFHFPHSKLTSLKTPRQSISHPGSLLLPLRLHLHLCCSLNTPECPTSRSVICCSPFLDALSSKRAHSPSSFGFLLKGRLVSEAVTGHPV